METITRCGTITAINDKTATVEFVRGEACSHCTAQSICSTGNSAPLSVEVMLDTPDLYHVGQNVSLEISISSAFYATFFAYILPLLLMLICLSFSLFLKISETTSATLTLLTLPLYYTCLFLFCRKKRPQIKIKVR